MRARRTDAFDELGMNTGVDNKKAGGRSINTVLVVGLGLPTMRALGRLLGKRFYLERAADATDCLNLIDRNGSINAVVVDPGVSEFDSSTFASLVSKYNPNIPLFFFGSAQDIGSGNLPTAIRNVRYFRSPSGICKLAEEILAVSGSGAGAARRDSAISRIVLKTLEYVEANYAQINKISDVSKTLGVSREHLSRQFTRYTGHTLSDFVTVYRVEKAKELLYAGSLVKQVYSEVGFKCESSFFRSFLKHVGITPRVYRETMLARKRDAGKQTMRGSFQDS
jgi:AraC-like DNA-binding protein